MGYVALILGVALWSGAHLFKRVGRPCHPLSEAVELLHILQLFLNGFGTTEFHKLGGLKLSLEGFNFTF